MLFVNFPVSPIAPPRAITRFDRPAAPYPPIERGHGYLRLVVPKGRPDPGYTEFPYRLFLFRGSSVEMIHVRSAETPEEVREYKATKIGKVGTIDARAIDDFCQTIGSPGIKLSSAMRARLSYRLGLVLGDRLLGHLISKSDPAIARNANLAYLRKIRALDPMVSRSEILQILRAGSPIAEREKVISIEGEKVRVEYHPTRSEWYAYCARIRFATTAGTKAEVLAIVAREISIARDCAAWCDRVNRAA